MGKLFATIISWRIDDAQIELKDQEGNHYYLDSCLPPDGKDAFWTNEEFRYNSFGELFCNGEDIGPWVLHTNDRKKAILQQYGK